MSILRLFTGAYSRWDFIYPEVKSKILAIESQFQSAINELDQQAVLKYNNEGAASAVAFTTQQCMQFGDSLVAQWGEFFGQLFMKYRDGYVISADNSNQACGCSPANAPYSNQWNDRIVRDTGNHYRVPAEEKLQGKYGAQGSSRSAAKLKLLARR